MCLSSLPLCRSGLRTSAPELTPGRLVAERALVSHIGQPPFSPFNSVPSVGPLWNTADWWVLKCSRPLAVRSRGNSSQLSSPLRSGGHSSSRREEGRKDGCVLDQAVLTQRCGQRSNPWLCHLAHSSTCPGLYSQGMVLMGYLCPPGPEDSPRSGQLGTSQLVKAVEY